MITVEVRHRRVGDGVDHLRALLDDARRPRSPCPTMKPVMFCRNTQRHVDLVAELDEVRRLLGGVGIDHAVVAEDADRVAVDRGPAADQRGAVAGLELLEPRAVDDPGDRPRARRRAGAGPGSPGRAARRGRGPARSGAASGPGPALRQLRWRHDLAAHADARPSRPRRSSRRGPTPRRASRPPPSVSSSLSSPVAIFTSGGPARKTFDCSLTKML